MQGRLSPPVNGRIQAFPWDHWRNEFEMARDCGFSLMEWTLDQERLESNPFMTEAGREEIRRLSERYSVVVRSVTGDCFMQAPFYKSDAEPSENLLATARQVIEACGALGVAYLIVPLVDNGCLESREETEALQAGARLLEPALRKAGVRILFESDYAPVPLRQLIDSFPSDCFGINYDIGNSASLGHDPAEEIAAYGHRVLNVHVKDRVRHGGTVPLGHGAADFDAVISALADLRYAGDFILQTARATNGDDAGVLCGYRDMVADWLSNAHGSGTSR